MDATVASGSGGELIGLAYLIHIPQEAGVLVEYFLLQFRDQGVVVAQERIAGVAAVWVGACGLFLGHGRGGGCGVGRGVGVVVCVGVVGGCEG